MGVPTQGREHTQTHADRHRQTETEPHHHPQTETPADRHRDGHRDRHTPQHTHTHTPMHTPTHAHTHTEADGERKLIRGREMQSRREMELETRGRTRKPRSRHRDVPTEVRTRLSEAAPIFNHWRKSYVLVQYLAADHCCPILVRIRFASSN